MFRLRAAALAFADSKFAGVAERNPSNDIFIAFLFSGWISRILLEKNSTRRQKTRVHQDSIHGLKMGAKAEDRQ